LKKKQWILGLIVLIALAAIIIWGRDRIHFDFAVFRAQLAGADWTKIAIGFACIYLAYVLRAFRWAMLMRHNKKVNPLSLVGTQVIGFTAVALIGRVADPVRPYLVARRTATDIGTQIAVYIVERLFDMGSMALIFSIAMFGVPSDEILKATGHSGLVAKLAASHPDMAVIVARYGGLALTLAGAIFLVAVRLAGPAIATVLEGGLSAASRKLGHAVGNKIRAFHAGLDVMRSGADFAATAGLSVAMWVIIALAYLETCRAFNASPQLAATSVQRCMLLMVASGGASIFQLPIIGWLTQIGAVAAALVGILGAGNEAATACSAMLLLVTFLGIVPVGLVWAQVDHISLRQITTESEVASEQATEVIEPDPVPDPKSESPTPAT